MHIEARGDLPVQMFPSDGTPARSVFAVARRDPHLGSGYPQPRRLDAEGRVTLKRCAPGPHKLVVSSESAPLLEQPVTILQGLNLEVVVRLPAKSGSSTGC